MYDVIVNTHDLVNVLDINYIEDILKKQGIETTDDNYSSEFKYRYDFQLKKYLLGTYFNWKLPDNYISMVDKMEYVLIHEDIFKKHFKILIYNLKNE